MALSRDDLLVLLEAFESSQWTELVLAVDGTRVELTSTGQPPAAAAHPPADARPRAAPAVPVPVDQHPSASTPGAPAPAATAEGLHRVTAPSVGTVYRSPQPGAPPFVEEGARVEPDDIVCIVEVMKLMNNVEAGAAGVVREIHVENGTMIEYGQVLFSIDSGG
jgi:acetyl-CoA carboxylase biotin carboxyl carrier protein